MTVRSLVIISALAAVVALICHLLADPLDDWGVVAWVLALAKVTAVIMAVVTALVAAGLWLGTRQRAD